MRSATHKLTLECRNCHWRHEVSVNESALTMKGRLQTLVEQHLRERMAAAYSSGGETSACVDSDVKSTVKVLR